MKKPRGTRVQFCGNIFFFCFTDLFPILVLSLDTISPAQPLADNQTLVSAGGAFELGLFTPGNSKWYLGIWYKKNIPTKTYVWVANRDAPLESSSAILKIGDHGNLVLLNHSHSIIWSSNQTDAVNPVAQLLDSGNFVVRKADSFDFLWQSFDYPADTLLPGMKLGWNRERGSNQYLRSWKSPSDPSPGDYAFKIDPNGFPEFFLWRKRERRYRSGPWNGLRFSGVPEMETGYIVNFSFVENRVGVYYSFEVESNSLISRLSVNSSGVLQRFMWIESDRVWNLFWYAPKDQCDNYRECGPYGICDPNASPVCKCPRGFRPRNPRAWYLRDGSGGCVRKTDSDSDCRAVGFLRMKNMKLPESSTASVDRAMSLKECEERCRGNCSCTAYASTDISDGARGCVIWSVELMDMRQYAELEGGQDLYVRLAASELDGGSSVSRTDSNGKREKILKIVGIAAGILTGALLFGLCNYYFWKKKTMRGIWKACPGQKGPCERSQDLLLSEAVIPSKSEFLAKSNPDELELPLFDLNIIITATDNFSNANKLGQGGFGCVYKGMFLDGQEVAVKRLSQGSGQGMEEFKNEVRLIARLQHRNLVRLLGCCIDMDEKMLIYEYMRHRSLDSVLFRKEKNSPLDWKKRFEIICGTARGLLYLHQDSRFRIIHRDLKASNILLDEEMNPKISDFGMARIFGRDQNEANTKKVVGTYGYMSPEYAMDGLFSVKSDVFSFGVLVLEIVSGKKNRGFYSTDDELNLLGHAWKLWNEQKALQLLDPRAGDSYSGHEALRCVQTGLLCVQERAEDRPTMATVMLMLNSETATMPQPKHPGFCLGRSLPETDSSSSKQDQSFTVNQVTVTALDAR